MTAARRSASTLPPVPRQKFQQGALDSTETALRDGDRPSNLHLPSHGSSSEDLVVVVPLTVAVVKPAHWCVSPVDDTYSFARVDMAHSTDEDVTVLTVLTETDMSEVGRAPIDSTKASAAMLFREGSDAMHLLDDGRKILRFS